MKPLISSLFTLGLIALTALFSPQKASAVILDGGIDPANLGKGDWIYYVSMATNKLGGNVTSVTNIPSFMAYEKNKGIDYIIVKSATGSTNFNGGGTSPQFNANLVTQAHAAGLKIFSYTRSYGDDVPGEIAIATNDLALGADGFVIDAESEWESGHQGTNGPSRALQLGSAIKSAYPTRFLGHAPFPYISLHSSLPYKEFGFYCDAVMPQDYWFSIGKTPAQMVADMDTEWRNWQNGLTGQWTNSIKPIVPIGQADTASIPASEITDFVNALKNDLNPATSGGYQGVNWWRADLHTSAQWTTIGTANIGDAAGTVHDIIVDNISATTVGTWATGTSATDKYATDYRSKGQGTGTAYLQFKPSFWTAGTYEVYEWHSQGSNRTTNAPHLITYSGGSQTVFVNQQVNGGGWNLLGTYNFSAGVGNNVRIKDNFSDAGQTLIADAIKFVYVVPAPPAAPSGLSATAASSSEIDLAWTDNSSNETSFVVSRSTTSGGPYTDIANVAANATSFHDSGLASSTTYYYVVGATNSGGASADSNQASATTQFAVADIIIDNPAATVVGTWSSGTGSTDKYGSDYRFKSQGTGSAYLQYTPNILTAGNYDVYEWHPIGSNRSLGTPHIITYNGSATTVFVNQQIAGGQWNLLGNFNFVAGTSGDVKITDGFSDAGQVALADAIKFVHAGGGPTVPNAPSGLSATAVSTSQINLSWNDNSSDESNFVVKRSTTSGGPYSTIQTLAANTTSFNNTGLSVNTTYYYVVCATNSAGSSANSAQASATTFATVPTAPSGLSAATISAGEIDLSWLDNSSNESSFVLGRSTTSGGPYSDIISLAANTTSYNNTGLSANTTYYYVVRATNSGGSSANSAQASATTLPFPPSAPGGLSATAVSTSQINLAWTDNSPNETSFTVARSLSSGGPYSNIVTLAANTIAYSDTNLAIATTYYYVVRASNSGGESPNSNEGSDTTFGLAPDAPSNLSAIASRATRIDLTWTDNSANESNFVLARSTTSGGPYTDIVTLAANTTSYSNTGLATNTSYYYVVRATNASGSSLDSNEASATTPESNLLIDNKSATVVGTWTTGSSATDRYGSDYQFANQGTGSAYVQFTPYVATAGDYEVYEWHPQGANRTTNAPHVITYNGGTQTVYVNQEINGGQWNYLGTFNFAAGSGGNVKITDAFPDASQVVLADAIKLVVPSSTTVTFTSVAAQDGYVLESSETSDLGGSSSATASNASALRVGDNNADRQYKTLVSFDTSSLPDGATIISMTLKLKRGSVTGTNPFNTHGTCYVDIKGGTGFGGAVSLANGDFQASADATQVATMSNPGANGDWSTGAVNSTGCGFVNKTGTTQFRVYFSIDDNDDTANDYVGFYSGDNGTADNRPVLEVVYQ